MISFSLKSDTVVLIQCVVVRLLAKYVETLNQLPCQFYPWLGNYFNVDFFLTVCFGLRYWCFHFLFVLLLRRNFQSRVKRLVITSTSEVTALWVFSNCHFIMYFSAHVFLFINVITLLFVFHPACLLFFKWVSEKLVQRKWLWCWRN